MPKNLMNKSHKTTNKKFRDAWDDIEWTREPKKEKDEKAEPSSDANELFNTFVKT